MQALFYIVSSLENQVDRKSKISDIEVVALGLTAEFLSIDSENYLFKLFDGSQIPNLLEKPVQQAKEKASFSKDQVRICLYSRFTDYEDYFIIDSMPL